MKWQLAKWQVDEVSKHHKVVLIGPVCRTKDQCHKIHVLSYKLFSYLTKRPCGETRH
jgi:hypothetical protein